MAAMTWREAMEQALYGERGFYRQEGGPAAHFRTSVHASPLFAAALVGLAKATRLQTVVDLGAGRGELLAEMHGLAPELRLVGIEIVPRPATLPDAIEWLAEMPIGRQCLVVANEWLDNVPVDVVTRAEDGERVLLVDPETGVESVGGPADGADQRWLDEWWPLAQAPAGHRAEIGRPRDAAWAAVIEAMASGVAVAADYGHDRDCRPPQGSLAGYRLGRQVAPVPDGTCDITASVAFDSCAAAGIRAGADQTVLTTQRRALHALGLAADRPTYEMSNTDPAGYLRALSRSGEVAQLLEPSGLGGFRWLVQSVGVPVPQQLTRTAS